MGVVLKREAGAQAQRRPLRTPENGVEPTLQKTQLLHGGADRRIERVAVEQALHAVARAGVGPNSPRPRRWEANEKGRLHDLFGQLRRELRVSHQGLTMTAGDVTIRTSGSVGLDESLAIMAEVPVRDEWVADKKYLSSLRGTVIQIPMQGTLSKPRLDNRMLRELSARMVGGAARGVLQDEVNRGLQRLFGPTMRGTADGAAGGTP